MGRHVAELGSGVKRVSIAGDVLLTLVRHMAHLRVLVAEIELTPAQGWLAFPRRLQNLNLRVTGSSTAEKLNEVLAAVGRLPLLKEFAVHLPAIDGQLSFAPLASLPLLRDLCIFTPNDAVLSDAQVAQLRALPLLERLEMRSMSTSLLRRLLAQPHNLQWQEIALPRLLSDKAAALLPQLPSLTALGAPTVFTTCSHFDFLRRLPNLVRVCLDLQLREPSGAGRIDSLMAALSCCRRIGLLSLISTEISAAHLSELLPRLPRLLIFRFGCPNISTLAFLAQPPMTDQLASLMLVECRRLPLTELRHVHALRGLKELRLNESFDEPMDTMHQMLHTPPSVLLPQLDVFKYTPPLAADQNDHEDEDGDEHEAAEAEGDVGEEGEADE
jgi:hypothetical protein